jgi:hypothetical protein
MHERECSYSATIFSSALGLVCSPLALNFVTACILLILHVCSISDIYGQGCVH